MKPLHESRPGIALDETEPPRRVLHVIYSFMIGGSEQLVLTLVRAMPNFVHGVVAVDVDGPLETEFRDAGATTWRLNRVATGRLKATSELRRIVREFKPDAIHSHHLHELIYALPASVGSGARLIHTEHEFYSLRASKPRLILRTLALACDAVTAVDAETADYLRRFVGISERKLAVVRNGICVESFQRAAVERSGLGLSDQDLVVGVVARLNRVKGHDILFRAFAAVLQELPTAALLVVGDGEERARLEKLALELGIAGRTRMLGSRRDIPELLSAMDVVALCSLEEGLPISLLEAMAAGKPVVATAVGGVSKLVHHESNGLLIPAGDPDKAAAAIMRLLKDGDLRHKLGSAGLAAVVESYSIDRTVDAYESIYRLKDGAPAPPPASS